jgi:hypothetical protein
MAFTNTELSAMLKVLTYCSNWEDLSELVEYDIYTLKAKIMSEMMTNMSYDLDCE